MSLSDTQRAILAAAAQHPERLAVPPERLPAGARQKVAQALQRQNLVINVHGAAGDATAHWMVDGKSVLLQITDAGLRAVGIEAQENEQSGAAKGLRTAEADMAQEAATESAEADVAAEGPQSPPAPQAAQDGPQAPAEATPAPRSPAALRTAATALLAAWDAPGRLGLDESVAALRAALAGKPARQTRTPRHPATPRKPREGTKQEQVLAMLRREDGATIAQIMETTGWQQHTVRGFFAGLKKRQGIAVEVLERVRQVGPDKQGSHGSYSVYRIADAG